MEQGRLVQDVRSGVTQMVCCLAVLVAACQQPPSPPVAAPPKAAAPAPAPLAALPKPAPPKPAPAVAMPSLDFLPGPLYYCVNAQSRNAIEYESRVEQLCRRHPEMGPCQYEREACRSKGGRVFTARGEEVTRTVENEYDRVVMRVRFPGDGAPAKR